LRITFFADHHTYGQLSNNGGTRTILLSQKELERQGHIVDVVASVDKYTWHKHKKPVRSIPKDSQAVIAVSVADIDPMLKKMKKRGIKCRPSVWVRGWPIWTMSEQSIISKLKRLFTIGGRVYVNASWLHHKLTANGIPSYVVFAGMDDWYDMQPDNAYCTVGCLYSKRGTKGWKEFEKLHDILGSGYVCENGTTAELKWVAFGTEKKGPKWLDKYLSNPSKSELEGLYHKAEYWFSPSALEGFHNPPAEAAMCGCLLLCRDIRSGGTQDYATPETAHLWQSVEEAAEYIRNPDWSKVLKCQELIKSTIGTREQAMKKFVEVL